ncbi:MAG: response regulator [Polyangiaceae bacterium]|nr:response regulator [Polyangiaceae bacterium]
MASDRLIGQAAVRRQGSDAELDLGPGGRYLPTLFHDMPHGLVVYELVLGPGQTPVDYRIRDLNSAYEALTGTERAHVVGRLATEAYAPASPPFFGAFTSSQAGAVRGVRTPLGRCVHIDIVRLDELCAAAVLTDITEFKLKEAELSKSAFAVRTMIENQPYLAWLKDREGRFLAVNTGFARACGAKTPEELVGKTDFDVWPLELAQGYVNDDQEVMKSRAKKVVEEPILDGQETRWSETFKSAIVNDQGEVIGTAGSSRDISERKRAEEDRRKLEQQVMQAQKLESLGVLAGGIAHDFNNLLTSILGNADLALGELSPDARAREHVQDVVRASRRAAELCRQMLAYSGKGHFVVQSVSINDVVEEMTQLLLVSISKKVDLRYELCACLPPVQGDVTQLRQVVMNLITNASEAIGDQTGLITLRTGVTHCDERYLESLAGSGHRLAVGRHVYLEVTDTGRGMDRETLSRIFDPFFTTKFTGRGLGLAAVLGIARGHQGGIRVQSEPGQGTTFTMLLPASRKAGEKLRHPTPAPRNWRGHGWVLLVDDEEMIREVAGRMLEKSGFSVIVAADGLAAIEIFKERRDQIRLVVLDMTMPRMDGESCLKELRRLDPGVRVIMTSGYNEQDIVTRLVDQGPAGFLQKPFTSGDLLPKIRESLGE